MSGICECGECAAARCTRLSCFWCCEKKGGDEGSCGNHQDRKRRTKRGHRSLGRSQLRWNKQKHPQTEPVAAMIHEHFHQQRTGQDAVHFTMNMARLYWFQASWKLQQLDDGEVDSWVQVDAFMKHVPIALVQTTMQKATRKIFREKNKKNITDMWKQCRKIFRQDGDHWSLQLSAAPAACGMPSSDVHEPEEEELADWGDSEDESEDLDDVPAAGTAGLRERREELISPPRPKPTGAAIEFSEKTWSIRVLTPTEQAQIHDVKLSSAWCRTRRDIAKRMQPEEVEHLRPQPRRGSFSWNFASDKPAPHMRRASGKRFCCALQGSNVRDDRSWGPWKQALGNIIGWVSPFSMWLESFMTWIQLRPAIAGAMKEIRAVTQETWHEVGMRGCSGYVIGEVKRGFWLRMTFDDTGVEPTEVYGGNAVRGWHGTSMYCISRVIKQMGLNNGFAQNTQGGSVAQGVFYMHAAQAHLCEGYQHYVMLNDDGWLVGPLLELCVNEAACAGTMKTSLKRGNRGSATQRIASSECVRLHSVFFHAIHVSEIATAEKAMWIIAEPGFHPLLELDPDEPWSDIVERSHERRHRVFL